MQDDPHHPPFPEDARKLLVRARDHWHARGGSVVVVPPTHGDWRGMPSNEVHSLAFAERQTFTGGWPGGQERITEDDVLLVPADRPYRVAYDERRRRYPALFARPMDEDVVVMRRNLPEERWHEVTWRFAGGTGRAFAAALDLALQLSYLAEDPWAVDDRRRAIATALDALLAATAAPQRASRGGPAVAVRCRRYLRRHLADPGLSVPQIAEDLGYHARRLGRQYLKETGESIRETLVKLRVHRAREILRQRELPIEEVARLSGFAGASQFSRAFKRIEGNPPRKYRKYGHLEEG